MDTKTLYLVCSLLTVFLTAGMACLAWGRRQDRYIKAWALADAVSFLGQIAIGLRGTSVPEGVSIGLTCPLLLLSVFLTMRGFQDLIGDRRLARTALVATLGAILGFWAVWLAGGSTASRTIVFSMGESILTGLLACYIWPRGRPALRWPLRISATIYGSASILLAAREVLTVLQPGSLDLQTSHGGEAAFLVFSGLTFVGVNYAFIWLIIADDGARHLEEQGRLLRRVEAAHDALEHQAADLRVAKGEAEAASAAKSSFLATMSHEIRTPLNGVIGFADLLLQSSLSDEQRRFVQLQRDAGAGLLAVINDILDFSKLEAGKVEIEPVDVDLPALLNSCGSLFLPAAQEKRLSLHVELEPSVPSRVRLDAHRLRQVITNLLNNAVKFTRLGSVTLHAAGPPSDGQARLRVEIRDTGIGIPSDKIGRLFQRFSQVDGSISREFGGTGLGLAISQRIIELMGGAIAVDSELGVGSSFRFEVPFDPPLLRPVEPIDIAGALEQAGSPLSGTRPLRILVAEDVLPNQIMMEIMLAKAGHDVTLVETGRAAVDAVREQDFDLVLMDMQMPEMDGLEAARTIRALPGPRSTTPIVALTANVMPEEVAACYAAGMQDHLAKPIEPRKLLALLHYFSAEAPVS
jgi:signal transduction histidine kinase/ActR/RegA family two-component response regulator